MAVTLLAERERRQPIVPSNSAPDSGQHAQNMPGQSTPVTPKLAATVMLLREGERGMEVFVQQRVGTMKFAAHQTAFPGGRVDPRDYEPHAESAVGSEWAARLDTELNTAVALTLAAVRETFEETGTLLTRNARGEIIVDTHPFATQREQLTKHELAFSQFLSDTQLRIDTELLRYWSNWITPKENPIRFDTHFFLAEMPDGAHADGNTTEAAITRWARPSDLLTAWKNDEISLMPPTWSQIKRLADFDSVANVMEFARTVPVSRTSSDFFDSEFMVEYFEKIPRSSLAAMGGKGTSNPLNKGAHGANSRSATDGN